MNKFTRGMSYIVSGNKAPKYLVHQVGLKSWRAMIFSHAVTNDVDWGHAVVEGNATTLYARLEELCKDIEVRAYSTHACLRK